MRQGQKQKQSQELCSALPSPPSPLLLSLLFLLLAFLLFFLLPADHPLCASQSRRHWLTRSNADTILSWSKCELWVVTFPGGLLGMMGRLHGGEVCREALREGGGGAWCQPQLLPRRT